MAIKGRAADARLRSIEKALQVQGHGLNATIRKEDAGDVAASATLVHRTIARLMQEAADLHPESYAGFAAKARIIVGTGYDLSQAGYTLLHSLVSDLDRRDPYPRR